MLKFKCNVCGKKGERKPSQIVKFRHHFCSRFCYYNWKKKNVMTLEEKRNKLKEYYKRPEVRKKNKEYIKKWVKDNKIRYEKGWKKRNLIISLTKRKRNYNRKPEYQKLSMDWVRKNKEYFKIKRFLKRHLDFDLDIGTYRTYNKQIKNRMEAMKNVIK